MSEAIHATIQCPICNQQLRVPLDRADLRLTCRECGHSWDRAVPAPDRETQKSRVPDAPLPRRINPRLHLALGIALPLLGLALFWYCLEEYREAGRHLTPASVSVSGYYRRDGTYVRPYHRRPPGGVAHDAPYERTRSYCQGGMCLGVAISLLPLLSFLLARQRVKEQTRSGLWARRPQP